MTSLFYAINIGTLAVWLSVAGLGTVAIVIPTTLDLVKQAEIPNPHDSLDTTVLTEEFTTGEHPPALETDTGTSGTDKEADVPVTNEETLQLPPEIPEMAKVAPLPRIPDLPPSVSKPEEPTPGPVKPRTTTASKKPAPSRPKLPTRATGGSPGGRPEAGGKNGNGGQRGTSGMSDAKRLAGGRMPGPSYPAEARARGQSGTVVVEFVVGENGSVTSAYAKRPSPWPILNERAVSAVRKWKFPPGKVSKYARPIVFQLN